MQACATIGEFPRELAIQDIERYYRVEAKMSDADMPTFNYDGESPIPQRVLLMPEFNAIWNEIKTWKVGVKYAYSGVCKPSGDAAYAILKALAAKGFVTLPEGR